ncbi:MAG: hypothetical protein HYU86_00845 [Chloroflexi bacterium]|nr:hypothetical protein [Chloroflexota bacterium]
MSKKSQASGYAARARKKKAKIKVSTPASYERPATAASPAETARESVVTPLARTIKALASKRVITPANPHLIRELTQIGITAGAMFAILVLLSFLLR